MKKISLIVAAVAVVTVGFFSTNVFASSNTFELKDYHREHNLQLTPKTCQTVGKAVIDVSQKVTNDADSGQAGNYWGFDYYTRHIQVWQNNDNDPNTWCAILTYDGDSFAVPGQAGPGDTSLTGPRIDSPVQAEMTGGDRIIINGSLLAAPTWPKKGMVGLTDYHCNILDDCPGYVNWLDQYFTPGYSDTFQYWGWTYKAGRHGIWINQCGSDIPTNPACTGNSGNIL